MPDPLLEVLLGLESQVWQALMTGDPVADAAALSDDFLGVYPDGFCDRAGHADQLRNGPIVTDYAMSDARVLALAPDLVLLAYRAEYREVVNGSVGGPETMYVSSLWRRAGDRWQNVFSQDTPAVEETGPP